MSTLQHAAFLPLKTVQKLVNISSLMQQWLQLPLGRMATADLPGLVYKAAINLAGCPAWQQTQLPDMWLCSNSTSYNPQEHSWTSEQRVQLLRAMAPLRHPHLTSFTLAVDGFELGQHEVAALQHSFGAGLTTLGLGFCTLLPSFWVALNDVLPNVNDLQLISSVNCHPPDINTFCSTRSTAHPLVLQLEDKLFEACGGAQLQASLRALGVRHVSVLEGNW
jgi:hypothetical protein